MYRDHKTGELIFSPSDLTKFWESEFASWMDRYDLECPGELTPTADDSMAKVTQAKGYEHEEATIARLEREGRRVFRIEKENGDPQAQTIAAMQRGEDIIFQARLEKAPFAGWADFLVRVDGPSKLGPWHYEIWDTKLAAKLKPYFVIQLSAYAEMIADIQGQRPEHMAIILGTGEMQRLRLDEFYFYYERVRDSFLTFHDRFDRTMRPDPEKYRSFGRWADEAQRILLEQDSVLQVANLSTTQARNLKAAGIDTMAKLAATTKTKIPKMNEHVLASLKIQARLQIESCGKERPVYLIRKDNPQTGLFNLPALSEGDVYFDMEGFPLVQGGLEYLWGNTYTEGGERKFKDFWAHSPEQEKKALEDFIDWVWARWQRWPDMHIYHYANYEIGALRRLMGRYATREEEVDELLRHEVFVDLFAVVRHGLYVGEPRYSIKNIEHLYRGKREGAVTDGGASVEFYNNWRNAPDGQTWEDSQILRAIRDYNIDDCDSTCELVAWLRDQQVKAGIPPRPARTRADEDSTDDAGDGEDLPALCAALHALAPRFPEAETLAHLVQFYRREAKPKWWRFFDRKAALPEELYDDPDCLARLEAYTDIERHGRTGYRRVYAFDPEQECKFAIGDQCVDHQDMDAKFKVENLDYERGYIALTGSNPEAFSEELTLIPYDNFSHGVLADAVIAFCHNWLANPEAPHPVTDFLRRIPPRLQPARGAGPLLNEGGDLIKQVTGITVAMDNTLLCIQGPPGTGKTYTAEHIIADLVARGKRVGITSNSHKAINNLLTRAAKRCDEQGIKGDFLKVSNRDEPELAAHRRISKAASASRADLSPKLRVIGGTAWTFAAARLQGELDYLFIDEAGQVSIANLIAVSQSTRNIILMGDQMQLAQPIQGSHPGQSGLSVLDYYLEDHATIPEHLGVFLPMTFRMHPEICSFVSGAVYENRLKSAEKCQHQLIDHRGSKHLTAGAGIFFLPVEHEGNSQAADEEVAVIRIVVRDLVGRTWTDAEGKTAKLTLNDILIVAPYNLQVRKLEEALGDGARVGSVDKFQGQEAPVVILSMCCSDAASSHRGIDFLFSKNRLNVAVSRAQAAAVIVGHPRLATTYAASVDGIAKVNMFCRLLRHARWF